MNNDRRKLFGTILGIVIFIICVISISYAFYKWKSNNTNVNITFDDPIIDFTMGSNVNATGLTPVLDYMDAFNYTTENSGKYVAYTEFTTDNQSNSNQYYKAKLDITTLDTALKTNTFKYSLLKKDTTSGEYDKLICDGNFSSFTTGDNNIICDGIKVSSNTQEDYRFVVYIDGNEKNDINMMNKSLESTLILSVDNDKNNIVTISLNNNNATSSGTTSIYQRYGVGIYKDNTASTTEMTTSTNNITIPTKTGYTFKGYYTENNSNGEQLINNNGYITDIFSITKYMEATTLYAGYETNKYYISYSLNNGKFNNTDSKPGIAVYDNIINISNPYRDGYKFIGWTSNDIDTNIAYYGDSDSSVTTKWSSTSTKVNANYFKNLTSTNEKTVTLTANFQDVTKPECTIETPADITTGNTTTVLLTCTDNDSLASNTLSTSDFTISDATIALVQSVSSATVVSSTKHQYTITIKGTSSGSYGISLNKGSIKDSAGNSNNKVTSGIANVTGTNIRDAEITISPTSYTYDNTAKTPSVTVKFGNVTLTKDTDYTVSYLNNVNVGTATVKVTGIGSYTGIVTKDFKINKRGLTITASSQTITYGEAITQGVDKVTVATLLSGHTITAVALTQSTTSATTSGTIMPSAAIIKDSSGNEVTNNYSITYKTGTLVINKKEITDSMVSISPTSYTYDGTAKTPNVTVVYNSVTLTKDTDYTVSYSNNIDGGTATVKVTGIGSYTGVVNKNFTIAYETYTITYDANGGSGAPSSQTKTYGQELTLSETIPVKDGYTFLGWSTSQTATSATYQAGGIYNVNASATLYAVWEESDYDIQLTSITIDGSSSNSLPTSGTYTLSSYTCSKGSTLTWNTYTKSITYGSGSKVKDNCSVIFTSSTSYPKLNTMEVGSYVAYTGSGGKVGSTSVACQTNGSASSSTATAATEAPNSCSGQNAREDLDSSGYTYGYCYSTSYKYYTTGWRIAYIGSNNKPVIVSAGSPECISRPGSSKNARYIKKANAAALKYCNTDYVDGNCTCTDSSSYGWCDSASTDAWAINDTDFYNMTKAISGYGKRLTSGSSSLGDSGGTLGSTLYCDDRYSYRECGYNNSLIDNGGYYWFAAQYSSSSTNAYGVEWSPVNRTVFSSASTYVYGLRPVISLSSTVYVTGGSGTIDDPYTIGN